MDPSLIRLDLFSQGGWSFVELLTPHGVIWGPA